MLVVVALLVLMMTIIVAIFREATGSVSAQQTSAAIDAVLRRVDTTLRDDLTGATAKFTPPLNPRDNLGYFTYEEHEHADAQGEDTDDIIAFTAKAPAGRPFVGRIWIPRTGVGQFTNVPVTITSDFAEITYFLRNGNLYRRVLLVKPEISGSLGRVPIYNPPNPPTFVFRAGNTNGPDSTIPASAVGFVPSSGIYNMPQVGWNAFNDISARPTSHSAIPSATPLIRVPTPNSLGDLTNRQNRFATPRFMNDYLDPNDFDNDGDIGEPDGIADDDNGDGIPDYYPTLYPGNLALRNYLGYGQPGTLNNQYDPLPFPFVFPGTYSVNSPGGWYHGMYTPGVSILNHAPVETGDSLDNTTLVRQTWWGRPTWRETVSPNWIDPVYRSPFQPPGQPYHLSWQRVLLGGGPRPLPVMTNYPNDATAGTALTAPNSLAIDPTTTGVWEDDLLATGVRSFDVKAFDPAAPAVFGAAIAAEGYFDLGYAQLSAGTDPSIGHLLTFGHEGRMPPLIADNRVDPQWPILPANRPPLVAGADNNIGDNAPGTIRIQRVFDTWSTDYTNAPSVPADPRLGPPFANPVYPSYPPPYPAPLRGIQIHIRLSDPGNSRVKSLTIKQDFTDKL
jgi:type II secretory pathway component PulJ